MAASPGGMAAGSSSSGGAKLFGCVVMTRRGVPLWQGWLFKPSAVLQTKPLCLAVSQVFAKQPDQDSSFITTGVHAVASVSDGDYIVSVVCSSACSEAEILMKAKELAHNVKLLFGSLQASACMHAMHDSHARVGGAMALQHAPQEDACLHGLAVPMQPLLPGKEGGKGACMHGRARCGARQTPDS